MHVAAHLNAIIDLHVFKHVIPRILAILAPYKRKIVRGKQDHVIHALQSTVSVKVFCRTVHRQGAVIYNFITSKKESVHNNRTAVRNSQGAFHRQRSPDIHRQDHVFGNLPRRPLGNNSVAFNDKVRINGIIHTAVIGNNAARFAHGYST